MESGVVWKFIHKNVIEDEVEKKKIECVVAWSSITYFNNLNSVFFVTHSTPHLNKKSILY